jgi:predicted nucleic acid-binding protein
MSLNSSKYYFIDANLIMYSLGGPHPLKAPCIHLLRKIQSEDILAVTNTEVLQEILYRYLTIGKPEIGEKAYRSLTRICVNVLPVKLSDTDTALALLKVHQPITSRDAIHAATMINNGIKEIISTDSHFDLLPEIKRIAPDHFR